MQAIRSALGWFSSLKSCLPVIPIPDTTARNSCNATDTSFRSAEAVPQREKQPIRSFFEARMMQRPEWISSVKTATRCTIALIGTFDDAARVTGISRSVLWRCASATDPDVISLTGAMRLMQETGCHDILAAMAASHGLTVTAGEGAGPNCLASAFGSVAEEFGEVASRVGQAIADGEITPNEQKHIAEAWSRLGRAVSQGQAAPVTVSIVPNGRAA